METNTTNSMSVAALIEKYHRYNASVGKSRATCQWHKYALSRFEGFAGSDRLVGTVDADLLDDYRFSLVESGLKTISTNTYLRSLQALLRWANRPGRRAVAHELPVVEFVRRGPLTPKDVISREEFDQLIQAAQGEASELLKTRAVALLMTLYDTGARASEICQAKYTDLKHFDVDGQAAHVLTIQGAKGGGRRDLPLHDRAWAAISKYRQELAKPHGRGYRSRGTDPAWLFTSTKALTEPLTVPGLRRIFERLEERCQVHANPHKFRHSFVSGWLNQNEGKEVETLIEITGWRDRRMLEVYGHYKTPTLVRAARRNSPLVR